MDKPVGTNWIDRAAIVAEDIGRVAADHDADHRFVADSLARLKDEGFTSALVPKELGGGGASIGEICQVIRLLGTACGSTALAFAMHSHQVATATWRWRHQGAPTDTMLRRIAAEKLVLVSSGGSDWLASGGTAVPCDGGFKVSARKGFSSGSPAADLLVTSAVFDDPEAGPTVLHFTVPIRSDGVRFNDNWDVIGMRGTGSQELVLDEVFVPESSILGRRPAGKWHMLFHIISMVAFALIYSAYVGIAEAARDKALDAARKRPADEGLVLLVGEMENRFAAAEMAIERMIRIAEEGQPGPETTGQVMSARTLVGQAAIATVDKAMEVAGGAAFYRKFGLERLFRDVQAARFHPLQEKTQLRYSGRLALGLDIDG
jgi:alkylation response protein AidB-like acyl-CoA dehydrogenase